MEELIAQQAEIIARLQDEAGDAALELKAAEEAVADHADAIRQSQETVRKQDTRINELQDTLEDVDITPQYRALYDLAAALLKKMTGAEKPTQAECHGIDEAYQLSKRLDEYDI